MGLRPVGRILSFPAVSNLLWFQKSPKGGVQGSKGYRRISSSGKERTTQLPNKERWVENDGSHPPRLWTRPVRCLCKKRAMKNEARAYLRQYEASKSRETTFSDLPQHELDKLCTVDRHPSDSFVFSLMGIDLHISTTSLWPTLFQPAATGTKHFDPVLRTGYGRRRDRQPHDGMMSCSAVQRHRDKDTERVA